MTFRAAVSFISKTAADLCCKCLDDVAMDVLYMMGNDHALEEADPLELAEIKRRMKHIILNLQL